MMSAIDRLLNNKPLMHDILSTYASQLKELKHLHRINCPECYSKERSCKKYYWLCLDLSEIEFIIREMEQEYRQLAQ